MNAASVLILLAAAAPALAHDTGHAPHAITFWNAWTLDPLVLVPMAVAALLYAKGVVRCGWREGCFAAGFLALFFALVWPLDVLGEQLFSIHMLQHMVLMNVAAPLLVLGAPLGPFLRPLPLGCRRNLARLGAGRRWRKGWRWLTGVAVASVLQQVVLWTWHTPRGVALALDSDPVHIAMHASLLVAALLFWTAVLRPQGGYHWAAIAGILLTLKVSGVITIVLMLQPVSLYPAYADLAAAWGFAPEQDEQMGWGIMMSIGTVTYLVSAVALFGASFSRLERSSRAHGAAAEAWPRMPSSGARPRVPVSGARPRVPLSGD
jgi:putative membrane protein